MRSLDINLIIAVVVAIGFMLIAKSRKFSWLSSSFVLYFAVRRNDLYCTVSL